MNAAAHYIFPAGAHTVGITITSPDGAPFTSQDLEAIRDFLGIWEKGVKRTEPAPPTVAIHLGDKHDNGPPPTEGPPSAEYPPPR